MTSARTSALRMAKIPFDLHIIFYLGVGKKVG